MEFKEGIADCVAGEAARLAKTNRTYDVARSGSSPDLIGGTSVQLKGSGQDNENLQSFMMIATRKA